MPFGQTPVIPAEPQFPYLTFYKELQRHFGALSKSVPTRSVLFYFPLRILASIGFEQALIGDLNEAIDLKS